MCSVSHHIEGIDPSTWPERNWYVYYSAFDFFLYWHFIPLIYLVSACTSSPYFWEALIPLWISVVCSTFIFLASGATSACCSGSCLILLEVSLSLATEALFSLGTYEPFSKVPVQLEITKQGIPRPPCSKSLESCFLGMIILQVITLRRLKNKEYIELLIFGKFPTLLPDFTTLTANGSWAFPVSCWQLSPHARMKL